MTKYPLANNRLGKNLSVISIVVSVFVLLLVGVMRQVKLDLGIDFSFLPPYHAVFNGIVSVFLVLALYFIKNKNFIQHRNMVFGAMFFSALFLVCYVLYHFTTEETTYCKEGMIKIIYFILLISHIVLAGLSLPFILITFSRGISFQVEKHKMMARWVYPIWLYVAITGPICYLMLKPCYQ